MTETTTEAPAATTTETSWFDGVDAETKGYIENRGLDKLSAKDAALNSLKAYQEASKKLGADPAALIRKPKDAGDSEAWDKIHGLLGVPKDAKDYDFTAAKLDDDTSNFLRENAFKNKLPKSAAEAMAAALAERQAKNTGDTDSQAAAKAALEQTELKKDWGFNFEANRLVAQRAVEKLGIDPAAVSSLEGKTGYKAVMQMFHKIGQTMGEDNFVTSQVTGKVMSQDGAKARITELKNDSAWRTKYTAGDTQAQKEFNDLHRIAYGEGAA